MSSHPPRDFPGADTDRGTLVPAAGLRPGRRLIAVMLLAAAVLDLSRCGIVMANARHAGPAAGLMSAGLAAAALSLWTAHGCLGGRRWSGWAALLIGTASAPQAAAAGFAAAHEIPDTATAALGVLLTVAVLATARQTGHPEHFTGDPCSMCRRVGRLSAERPGSQATGGTVRHLPPGPPGAGLRTPAAGALAPTAELVALTAGHEQPPSRTRVARYEDSSPEQLARRARRV